MSPTPLRRSALLGESLSLELRRKQGLFRLEVREVAWGPGESCGPLLGVGWYGAHVCVCGGERVRRWQIMGRQEVGVLVHEQRCARGGLGAR